ncbi:MAG: histidinol-phosphate transaminase [Acidobacteria bacterium]|nr:histidinol-phosphate transaminase [Acidobacteriota bacterium]
MPVKKSATSLLKPRRAIARMTPYHPPSSGRSGKMRLDFNENTVGCSPHVVKRLAKLRPADLAAYPEYDDAVPALALFFHVKREELALTNGTDEAIQLIINTYVDPGDRVLILRPSYAMYRFYAQVMGGIVDEIDFRPDLSFPAHAIVKHLETPVGRRTCAVLIANPNNPTGTSASSEQLRAILRAAPQAAVLVDEAYFEFFGQTAIGWLGKFPNLFVSRTFSKAFGLAALRIGCLFSQAENISAIRKGQSPYSVNAVAVIAALEAIKDPGYVKKYVAEMFASRKLLCDELKRLGLSYGSSDANFVLIDFGEQHRAIRDLLAERGILVRDRDYEISGNVRFTVGTLMQTRTLIRALRRAVRQLSAQGGSR